MPALSLVVCIYGERHFLERLLEESAGLYDDLVVIHDGPLDLEHLKGFEQLLGRYKGRFFVRPRTFQQEPHWPFAWEEAKHDWILRLDADEFPSEEMKKWLRQFRIEEPDSLVSGYTCVWPLWNGTHAITKHWPAGRIFLFDKQRVHFFGMVEQVPVAEHHFQSLELVLEHRPSRSSYGITNLILRPQAFHWRRVIAQSLLGKPTDLSCWRWTDEQWPEIWDEIRRHPIRTAIYRLFIWPLRGIRDYWRYENKLVPSAIVSAGVHHCLIALSYWWKRRSA